MQLNCYFRRISCANGWNQNWKVMRLTAIFLLAGSMMASASGISQKISFSGKDVPFQKILSVIEDQTGYVAVTRIDLLDAVKPVTVSVKNMPLKDFLTLVLKDQQLVFSLDEKNIVLTHKPLIPKPPLNDPGNEQPPISGFVYDRQGAPLAGVNISVKNTKRGTVSDHNGFFKIEAKPGDVLLVSSINYTSREIEVGNNDLAIYLDKSVSQLDEVQYIAYGVTSKRLSTGNTTTIKAAEIEKQPVNNPLLALQGRVPGLYVSQANGVPGGGLKIRVQGINSLVNGNEPFYVIDGVPYSQTMLPTFGAGLSSEILGLNSSGGVGNPLAFINPADIVSIDILKDADATAIYGSRAANGAILITTKKGQTGATKWDINFQTGISEVARKVKLLTTPQFIEMRKEALSNDNDVALDERDYDIKGLNGWDTTRTKDWQKELIGNTGKFTRINTSVSSGNNELKYLVGATYQKETTVFPGSFANTKGGIHFNLNGKSTNGKFKVDFSGNYNVDENNLPKVDLTRFALNLAPTAPDLFNDDGTLNWGVNEAGNATWDNPLVFTISQFESKTKNLLSSLQMSYSILRNLEVKTSFGYTNLNTSSYITFPLESARPEDRPFLKNIAEYSDNVVSTVIVEPQIKYNTALWIGRLDVLLGGTYQYNTGDGIAYRGEGYASSELMRNRMAAPDFFVTNTFQYQYKYAAGFGRIGYNIADKHIINLSARRDGSSRFGAKSRFNNFYSAGYGYILSEEEFFKQLRFVSFAKIRSSYGTTGSDQIPNYAYLNLYTPVFVIPLAPYQDQVGLTPVGIPNPYLEWEETRKLNIGIDLGFLDNRILLSANYARNRSSNQLLVMRLPGFTGFSSISSNIPALVENRNWEFTLNTGIVRSKDFTWDLNFNVTLPKNALKKYEGVKMVEFEEGESLSISRVFKYAGVNPSTGVYEFFTAGGERTSTPDNVLDRTEIIDMLPQYYGGIENVIRIKEFSISALFQFVKQAAYNLSRGGIGGAPGFRRINQPVAVMKRWQKPGDEADVQRFNTLISPNAPGLFMEYGNMQSSDASLQQILFARLKNVSVSYTIPSSVLSKIRVADARLFVNAQNLVTFTTYDGMDPETENGVLPPLRVITFGLQITL